MTHSINKHKNLYKTLGPVSSHLITELNRSNKTVFSSDEAAKILGTNTKHIKKLLHDLLKKGWLMRIEKGKYFLTPLLTKTSEPYTENQFLIASKLIYPYYIGFWSMLHYYGYTEQLANTIFIASPKRKKDISLSGVNYKFIKTTPEKMFGLTEIMFDGMSVRVSDKEKTLLDCLDHPEYCGGTTEAVKGIWNAREEIDFEKILSYANKMNNSAVTKRLGYLLEVLELNKKVDMKSLKETIGKGYASLDPHLPKKGQYNSQWNILVNIPTEELLSFKKVW